jgi:glycine dehydrogenase subunit 1
MSESHVPYLPHTDKDRQEMLKAIGVSNFEELVKHIPKEIRVKELALQGSLSEIEVRETISKLAAKNTPASRQASFLGGGSYRRYTPAALESIVSRSEFATAYTPYQPEVSQGTLQTIYEFQTAICLLTGMDVANASLYDGPTACAEAALMACRLTDRQQIYVAESLNPEYKKVTQTYAQSCGLGFKTIATPDGFVKDNFEIQEDAACIIVQYSNYFGILEDLEAIGKRAKEKGCLLVVVSEPISLGLLTAPADFGADIVVGDAQPCGNFLSFGGPSAGYLACRKEFVRQLPGRVCGMTQDSEGKRAYTLTLQTREQHIRRAKATSNICTNQALNALSMLVYIVLMGPIGLRQLSEISVRRAHYLKDLLTTIPSVKLTFAKSFFNEFVIETTKPATLVLQQLQKKGVLGGIALSADYPSLEKAFLVSVTEMNSISDLNKYAQALKEVMDNAHDQVLAGKATPANLAK